MFDTILSNAKQVVEGLINNNFVVSGLFIHIPDKLRKSFLDFGNFDGMFGSFNLVQVS